MIRELNHVAIRCADMNTSINFYRDILGGKVIRYIADGDGSPQFVYVQIAAGVIELIKGNSGADNLGLAHVAYLTDANLDSVYEKLIGMGYEFTIKPKISSSGDGRLAFFKDKSGAVFELIEREEDIRIPNLQNEYIEEFDHISIKVSDDCYKECEDFYLNTLGFTVRRILEKHGSVMSYYKFGADTLQCSKGIWFGRV